MRDDQFFYSFNDENMSRAFEIAYEEWLHNKGDSVQKAIRMNFVRLYSYARPVEEPDSFWNHFSPFGFMTDFGI